MFSVFKNNLLFDGFILFMTLFKVKPFEHIKNKSATDLEFKKAVGHAIIPFNAFALRFGKAGMGLNNKGDVSEPLKIA